jgi:hypothetical protein
LILKLIWLIISIVFEIVWKILQIVIIIILFVIRIIVGVFVGLYFLIRAFFPENGKTPFFHSKKIASIENIYRMEDLPYTLYIDLNHVLVYFSEAKPASGEYHEVVIHEIDSKPKTLYVQKRPYLAEFLEEVK